MATLRKFLIVNIEEVEEFDNSCRGEVVFLGDEVCEMCVFYRVGRFYGNTHRLRLSDCIGDLHLTMVETVVFYEVAGDIVRHISCGAVNF